jgi:hypothetical protein
LEDAGHLHIFVNPVRDGIAHTRQLNAPEWDTRLLAIVEVAKCELDAAGRRMRLDVRRSHVTQIELVFAHQATEV